MRNATYCCANLVVLLSLLVVPSSSPQAQPATSAEQSRAFPRFRHPDPDPAAAAIVIGRPVVLLADEDFAPWSFRAADGALKGIAVEMAEQACAEAGLACTLKPMAFGALRKALAAGDGDAIVSGLRANEQLLGEALLTRPYFLSLARFYARQGTSLPSNDPRALAGKRVGFVRNSAHGVFLERHYGKSPLAAYDRLESLTEALRTGAVDVIFADSIALAFWQDGQAARGCCVPLGQAFADRSTFSRGLFIAVRPDNADLRDAFDLALDALEEKGETARVFTDYLPGPVW